MSVDVRAELEGKEERQFDELQTYLKENSNGEKYGNANTIRMAVRLAHEKMEELKEEKQETVKDFKKHERKLKKLVDDK